MVQKYFISYAAYSCHSNNIDFFNDIIVINEDIDIDMKLLEDIQESLKNKLNENCDQVYYVTQIINLVKM